MSQDRNGSTERLRFEGGWSKAEFLALERRWSFLARLGATARRSSPPRDSEA